MKIVLQKYLSQAGFCSRRNAEELIKKKKVRVNGEIAELGARVDSKDEVIVNGKKLNIAEKKIYIKLNKPKGYVCAVCTSRKFKGEKNVFDLIETKEKLIIAGRLDKDSEGLLVLSNDGDFVQKLTHPKYEHEKEYEVRIKNYEFGIMNKSICEKLIRGVDIGEGDGVVKAKDVKYIGDNKFKIILTEGKKRQIRRMFKKLGCQVVNLKRIRIKNIKLGELGLGKWVPLTKEEIEI